MFRARKPRDRRKAAQQTTQVRRFTIMKAFPSLLAVAALVAAGTVPLVGQQASDNPVQVEAKITNLDASAGLITLETTKMPGQEGTTTELRYAPSHPAALT